MQTRFSDTIIGLLLEMGCDIQEDLLVVENGLSCDIWKNNKKYGRFRVFKASAPNRQPVAMCRFETDLADYKKDIYSVNRKELATFLNEGIKYTKIEKG